MWIKGLIGLAAAAVAATGAWLLLANTSPRNRGDVELLNVSCDPTRELWRDMNAAFIPRYEKETGTRLTINQSHGGSGTQARAVADGLEADVVTLALWSDTELLHRQGLLADGWQERLPNHSLPYFSTIVFVVRKGNPRGVHDWPDLVKPGVAVITPNPKTSGNGRLSFLAAWGAVVRNGGSEDAARDYVTRLYRQVPVLDSGARGSTTTFAQKNIGDVHLTWENEAALEVEESGGALEVVYPSASIRAEPYVAVVDATVDHKGTRAAAEAYLRFAYTDEGQEIFARHHYRPINPEVLRRHAADFPDIGLFPVTTVARDWGDAQKKFFAEGAVFDRIYQPRGQ
ncbi:MAG TPA: sulfate ABC transporter substrate-binding protein [Gemmataceae bacterium]|nr:sulfate ABC transporter substrate-binding protein [Gemmataceae bacterium]